jgi:hypothetical protein
MCVRASLREKERERERERERESVCVYAPPAPLYICRVGPNRISIYTPYIYVPYI